MLRDYFCYHKTGGCALQIKVARDQSKSPTGLMLHVVQYSAQNKISMSMSKISMSIMKIFFILNFV